MAITPDYGYTISCLNSAYLNILPACFITKLSWKVQTKAERLNPHFKLIPRTTKTYFFSAKCLKLHWSLFNVKNTIYQGGSTQSNSA